MDLTYSAPTKIQCDANKDTAYERVAKCLHRVSDLLKNQTLVTWRISALRITICLTMHHSLIISSYKKHIKVFASKKSCWLEKAVAPHSSTVAWKIPWMEEPGRLQSMGSLGVGYDWVTSLYFFAFMYWRRKWQPTPVFLPGESQGQWSLVVCRLWGCTESDTTEAT